MTSGQHYGMGYGYSQMPQFETSTSTSQSSTSAEYRGFGFIILVLILYYRHHHITRMIHLLPNHLSLPEHSNIHPIILMDPFFTYRKDDFDGDFVPHRNSM